MRHCCKRVGFDVSPISWYISQLTAIQLNIIDIFSTGEVMVLYIIKNSYVNEMTSMLVICDQQWLMFTEICINNSIKLDRCWLKIKILSPTTKLHHVVYLVQP